MDLEADTFEVELKVVEDESKEDDGIGYTPSLLNPL